MFNRRYIFKWWIFHRYVSLLEGTSSTNKNSRPPGTCSTRFWPWSLNTSMTWGFSKMWRKLPKTPPKLPLKTCVGWKTIRLPFQNWSLFRWHSFIFEGGNFSGCIPQVACFWKVGWDLSPNYQLIQHLSAINPIGHTVHTNQINSHPVFVLQTTWWTKGSNPLQLSWAQLRFGKSPTTKIPQKGDVRGSKNSLYCGWSSKPWKEILIMGISAYKPLLLGWWPLSLDPSTCEFNSLGA